MKRRQPPIDYTGNRFSFLTVLRRGEQIDGRQAWVVRCDCGAEKLMKPSSFAYGGTKSCGCKRNELRAHLRKHGSKHTSEYWAWRSMKQRCLNPNCADYKNYGGRGIKVCDRWLEFQNFLADMGRRPSPRHSLDRLDNNKGYEPGNCLWRTYEDQNNNTRANRFLELNGRTQTMAQWAREYGLPAYSVSHRISRGWSLRDAVLTPLRRRIDSRI
jgi:hypothetical protein